MYENQAVIRPFFHLNQEVRMNAVTKLYKIVAVLTFIFSASVQAVTINFDDLEYVPTPDWDHFGDHPLSDEYADLGVFIHDGFLARYYPDSESTFSAPNYLLMGYGGSLEFIDQFPTMVSMYVSSGMGERIYLSAYDINGDYQYKSTEGWAYHDSTTYTPNQLITFYSSAGIHRLNFDSHTSGRVNASIDDLTYTYSEVPEPSPGVLILLGLSAVLWRMHQTQKH